MLDIKELADKADVIIDGYAFFRHEQGVRVLNLNNITHAAVFSKLTEAGSAKFFVKENGDTEIRDKGMLSRIELGTIKRFIKENYKEMYKKWSALSDTGFFVGK